MARGGVCAAAPAGPADADGGAPGTAGGAVDVAGSLDRIGAARRGDLVVARRAASDRTAVCVRLGRDPSGRRARRPACHPDRGAARTVARGTLGGCRRAGLGRTLLRAEAVARGAGAGRGRASARNRVATGACEPGAGGRGPAATARMPPPAPTATSPSTAIRRQAPLRRPPSPDGRSLASCPSAGGMPDDVASPSPPSSSSSSMTR
jgi:hypothetical protein